MVDFDFVSKKEIEGILGKDYILFVSNCETGTLMRADALACIDFRYDSKYDTASIEEVVPGLYISADLDKELLEGIISTMERIFFEAGFKCVYAKDDYEFGPYFKRRGYVVGGNYQDKDSAGDLLLLTNHDAKDDGSDSGPYGK